LFLRFKGQNILGTALLPGAYAELGELDDALHCIVEAITAAETTKEMVWQAEVHRVAEEIARVIRRSGLGESGRLVMPCARDGA
jgi:hypothetical protein